MAIVPKFRSWSIRWRLTAWYAISMLFILIVAGALAYFTFRATYIRETDKSLTVKGMEVISSAVSSELLRRHGTFLAPPVTSRSLIANVTEQFITDSYDPVGDPIYMRLFRTSPDRLVLISHNVQKHDLIERTLKTDFRLPTQLNVNGYFVGKDSLNELRVVNIRLPRQPYVLQLATPWQRYESTLAPMIDVIIAVIVFGFALSALGGWMLVSRTLRPITEIVTEAAKMSGDRLEPAFVAARTVADDEIGDLVKALNAMMGRVHQSIVNQRQFTADASHDLRTPLSILRGEMELALSRDRSSDEYRRVLISGLEETDRLTRIVRDLQDLASAEYEEGYRLHRTNIDLVKIANSVIASHSRQAAERKITLSLMTFHEPIIISANASSIERAIANLVENAICYNVEGGKVDVLLSQDNESVCIDVRDTGIGISADERLRIFNRFYRGDKSRSSFGGHKNGNSGLGLAIVKSVVEAHYGDLSVTSELGRGSVFTIKLTDFER